MKVAFRALLGSALIFGGFGTAVAQDSNAPATAPIFVAPAASNVLRAGTPIALRTSEQLTTKGKNLRVGNYIDDSRRH